MSSDRQAFADAASAANLQGLFQTSAPRILDGFEEFRAYQSLDAALGDASKGDPLLPAQAAAAAARRDVSQDLWKVLGPGTTAWIAEDRTGAPIAYISPAEAIAGGGGDGGGGAAAALQAAAAASEAAAGSASQASSAMTDD